MLILVWLLPCHAVRSRLIEILKRILPKGSTAVPTPTTVGARPSQFLGDALGYAFGVTVPSGDGNVRAKSAGMGKKMAKGNLITTTTGKCREVFSDRIVNAEFATLV